MEDHDREVTQAPEEVAPLTSVMAEEDSGGQPDNLLGALREKRKEISETKETYIAIPGYDGEPPILMANYRLMDGTEIDKIARKIRHEVKDNWQRQVLSAVDLIINACQGLYIDLDDGNEPQPMTLNGVPVDGYNSELATALEFEATTARQVVFGVFGGNDVAIMQHSARLGLWMADTTRDVDMDFLGEA
jgi:hypothetical protein